MSLRISLCLGCTGHVVHTHDEEDETIYESSYCDECLKGFNKPPRGFGAELRAYDRDWEMVGVQGE